MKIAMRVKITVRVLHRALTGGSPAPGLTVDAQYVNRRPTSRAGTPFTTALSDIEVMALDDDDDGWRLTLACSVVGPVLQSCRSELRVASPGSPTHGSATHGWVYIGKWAALFVADAPIMDGGRETGPGPDRCPAAGRAEMDDGQREPHEPAYLVRLPYADYPTATFAARPFALSATVTFGTTLELIGPRKTLALLHRLWADLSRSGLANPRALQA